MEGFFPTSPRSAAPATILRSLGSAAMREARGMPLRIESSVKRSMSLMEKSGLKSTYISGVWVQK